MNLQQLNGSGRSIATFIMTTILAVILTGACWFLLSEVRNLQDWKGTIVDDRGNRLEKPIEEPAVKPQKWALSIRLTMLVWLVWNGRTKWMVRSGAAWCILTNSDERFSSKNLGYVGSAAGYVNEAIILWKGSDDDVFVVSEGSRHMYLEPRRGGPFCGIFERRARSTDFVLARS